MRFWLCTIIGFWSFYASADEPKNDGRYEWKANHDPNGIGKFYMGREIAHVMGHAAATWLERRSAKKRSNQRSCSKRSSWNQG